jgi:hypothetical protein
MTTTRLDSDLEKARASRRGFVFGQVHGVRPLEFVSFIAPSAQGFSYIEVSRDEQDQLTTIEVGGSPAPAPGTRTALEALRFTANDDGSRLRWRGSGADQVASLVDAVLDGPLAVAPDAPLDVHHGSRRAAVELERKLVHVRERIQPIVNAIVSTEVVTEDADRDLSFPFESTRVWVGTRLVGDAEIVVRVLALAAVEVDSSPALGLFLAQANFASAIGKFSLDAAHRVVWFEEALLGEAFSDDELRRIIELVGATATRYDEQIAHMFGGRTARQAVDSEQAPPEHEKPGSSGYL